MPTSCEALREQKKALRQAMRSVRRSAAEDNPEAPESLRDVFFRHMTLPPDSIIAATMALPGEMNPGPLCAALRDKGHALCLPCIVDTIGPLSFRTWEPDASLVPGAYGVPEPPDSSALTDPDVILVPLLAFDRRMNRLGQGGGYYDRTLRHLREKRTLIALGLAFAAQGIPSVPVGPSDEPLDAVITESGVIGGAFMKLNFS